MRKKFIALLVIVLLLPYLALLICGKMGLFLQTPAPGAEPENIGMTVEVWRSKSGTLETVPLREYLWGVLAGEMPATYPEEALKAQAVASYSYLLHRKRVIASHPATDFGHDGEICDDPAHCKSYCPPEECCARWGVDWYEASAERIRTAVESVLGVAVLYEDAPANTVFFAFSGGQTEDAADVWGADVPYLRSVDSHWDADAPGFETITKIPLEEFCETIGCTAPEIGAVTLTSGGSVSTMILNGKTYTGRELRALFDLRSTRFSLRVEENQAVFTVRGYGHQVGMSQFGASVLARSGYSFREILSYYYTGVSFAEDFYE